MKVYSISEQDFIPEWNGNTEDESPVVFVLQPLTSEKKTKCLEIRMNAAGDAEVVPDFIQYFKHGVKEIKNLEDEAGPLKTARAVLQSNGQGLDRLVREVGTHIFVMNQLDDKKK